VGYGSESAPEAMTLELVELSTGRVLLSKDMYMNYGKAKVLPLAISKSGEYKVRLLANGTEYDSYRFTVTRSAENSPGTTGQTEYAKGLFSVMLQVDKNSEAFRAYNEAMQNSLLQSAVKETRSAPIDLFVQRQPGQILFQGRQFS